MRSQTLSTLRLAAFWFGIQALWGALLGLSLQARTLQLHPHGAVIAYGELAAAGAAVAILVQVLAGTHSDRRRRAGKSRTPYFVWGTAIAIAGIAGFYAAPSFALMTCALVVLQAGMNVGVAAYQPAIPDYVPASAAGRASASMAALQSLGNAAGVLTIVGTHGGGVAALILAAVLALSCAVTTRYVRRIPMQAMGDRAHASAQTSVDLFCSRAFMWAGFYTVLGYMVFYMRDTVHAGDSTTSAGLAILLFTIFGALGAALAAGPADRMDRRAVVTIGAALVMAALCGLLVGRSALLAYALGALAGAGWGAFLAADWALGCTLLPSTTMARSMALWNVAVAGPQIAAPAMTTGLLLLLRPSTETAPLFALCAALCELGLGAAWIWRLPHGAAMR